MNVYAVLSLAAVAFDLLVGVYVLSRGPRVRLNRLFFWIMLALVAWSGGEAVMRAASTVQAAAWGSRIAGIGWCFVGSLFVLFALEVAQRPDLARSPFTHLVVFTPGLVLLALLWTTDLIFEGFTHSYWGFQETGGVLRFPSKIYVVAMFLVGIGILIRYLRTHPPRHKRLVALFILVASSIPVLTGIVTDVLLPEAGVVVVELPMLATTLIAPIMAYAVLRRGVFNSLVGSMGGAILSSVNEAVLVASSAGLIETVNPAAETLTGYNEDELVGTPVADLFIEGHRPSAGTTAESGHPEGRTWCLVTSRGGELVPVTKGAERVTGRAGKVLGSVLVLNDMREALRLMQAEDEVRRATARVEAERGRSAELLRDTEELRELSDFLENAMENVALPLAITDRDTRIIFANRALCEMAGHPREYLLGRTGYELIEPDEAEEFEQKMREVQGSGEVGYVADTEITDRLTGEKRIIKAVIAPLKDDSGQVEHLALAVTDVTREKQLDDARLDFIRVAAHELRTPLTSLKLGLELLARETRGMLNPDQQRSLDVLSLSIERLSRLAKNLLDLASMDAGLFTLDCQMVDVARLCREAAGVFEGTMRDKGLECGIEIEEGLSPALADPSRLAQVLNNLMSNAVKYTDSGGITVSALGRDGEIEVSVRDTGVGIPVADREAVFSRFVKAQSDATAREGTGLGLSIAKAIVEEHGGRIWVESRVGEGSCFHFTVPAMKADGIRSHHAR